MLGGIATSGRMEVEAMEAATALICHEDNHLLRDTKEAVVYTDYKSLSTTKWEVEGQMLEE
jgi:hypothetical protein